MELSKRGLELIKSFEGCRLTAYQCAAGVWTIGYGHTSGVKKGDKITQDQADAFLKCDCSRFVKHVNDINDKYHYGFNQNEFDALVSFAYNIGNIRQLTMNGQRNKFQIGYNMQFYVNAGTGVFAIDACFEMRQNGDGHNGQKSRDQRALKEGVAQCQTDRSGCPKPCGGGQTRNAEAALDDDGSRTEKTDTRDDLGRNTTGI